MSTLFRRDWQIIVDTLDVSSLDFEFEVLATLKPEPNKGTITVWNLTRDHIAQLLKRNQPNPGAQLVGIPVQIKAGYVNSIFTIFDGDLNEVGGGREFTDRKVTITGQDGGRAYREGRISATFAAGTSIGTILLQCCRALKIGIGNAADFTSSAQINGFGTTIPAQMVLDGSAAKELTRLIKSIGLTWSIQNKSLLLLQKGKPLNQEAIKLTPTTGLLGSPEAAIDSTVSLGNPQQFAIGAKQTTAKPNKPKNPGILKLNTLMIPGLVPGKKISLESDQYTGDYMATECRYRGQSWSGTWGIEVVVRQY